MRILFSVLLTVGTLLDGVFAAEPLEIGSRLVMNFATSGFGSLRVELQDADGHDTQLHAERQHRTVRRYRGARSHVAR